MLFVGRHGNINKNPDIEVLVAHDYLMLYIVVRKCQKNIGATPYLALWNVCGREPAHRGLSLLLLVPWIAGNTHHQNLGRTPLGLWKTLMLYIIHRMLHIIHQVSHTIHQVFHPPGS